MNRRTGFSLIELMAAIAVMSILLGITISFGNSARQQVALQVEGANITQFIARARGLAIAIQRGGPADDTCGYQVRMNYVTKAVYLERFRNADCTTMTGATYDELGMYPLNINVSFGLASVSPRLERIVFLPPEPTVKKYNEGGVLVPGNAEIPLVTTGGAVSLTLIVSSAGQVTY